MKEAGFEKIIMREFKLLVDLRPADSGLRLVPQCCMSIKGRNTKAQEVVAEMRLVSVLEMFAAEAEITMTRRPRFEAVYDLGKDDITKDRRTYNKVLCPITQ